MINSIRKEKDWEAEFGYITYTKAKEIEKDENVEMLSMCYDIGLGEENFATIYPEFFTVLVNLKAYDKNYIDISNIELLKRKLS